MLKRKQNLFGEVKNAMYCAVMNITFSKKEGTVVFLHNNLSVFQR